MDNKPKILFVYINIMGLPHIHFGIASLSAYLKSKGYVTGLLDFTFGLKERKAIELAKEFKPDIVCFSAMSHGFEEAVSFACILKEQLKVPIICGGVHSTIAPQDALRDCFDGICVGEGEGAILELLQKIQRKESYLNTPNFWFRDKGHIIKNPMGPMIQNLDELPLLDYTLFDIKKYLRARDGQFDYKTARGCNFNCSYCINHLSQKLYKVGGFLRQKSVDKVISELNEIIRKYNPGFIFFSDETFNISTKWLKEFSTRYRKEINIPFECCVRADLCNDENMSYLKQANCTKINIAIESGDEELRKNLLNKYITDENIIKAFELAKKYKIHTMSYNMIGLPLEKPEQIEKTIALNKKVESDSLQVSIFVPYYGTELYNYCKKHDLILAKKIGMSYYFGNYLKNPHLTPKQLEKYRRWFSYRCYEDRSKIKATFLLARDTMIPYYLKYGKYIPVWFKKTVYYLFWHMKALNFMSK